MSEPVQAGQFEALEQRVTELEAKIAKAREATVASIAGSLVAGWWGQSQRKIDNPSPLMLQERAVAIAAGIVALSDDRPR